MSSGASTLTEKITDLEQVVDLALKLSPLDKVHLVERVVLTLEQDFKDTAPKPRRSLRGILSSYGSAPSAEEIDEARREMWGNFPREDI
jgi:hypothetical protein